jgi:hypothetical protein
MRDSQLSRALGGRLDDELDVVSADQAGTTCRRSGFCQGQTLLVARVDHIPGDVLIGGDKPSERRGRCP